MKLTITIDEATIKEAALNYVASEGAKSKNIDLTLSAGRQGRGFTGLVELSDSTLKAAVAAYVGEQNFPGLERYYSVKFIATRGDAGFTAEVTASDEPFADEPEAPAAAKSDPVKEAEPADNTPVEAPAEPVAEAAQAQVEAAEKADDADTAAAPTGSIFAGLNRPQNG